MAIKLFSRKSKPIEEFVFAKLDILMSKMASDEIFIQYLPTNSDCGAEEKEKIMNKTRQFAIQEAYEKGYEDGNPIPIGEKGKKRISSMLEIEVNEK